MNAKTSIPRESSIRQHLGLLRDIADNIRYDRNASPEYRGIERLSNILAKALTNLDERVSALEQFDANRVYVARLEDDILQSWRFTDLASLVEARCPKCRSEYDVIAASGRFFARCVSPKCEQHGVLWPVSRRLALEWNDLAQAEDTAYAESDEEANNG